MGAKSQHILSLSQPKSWFMIMQGVHIKEWESSGTPTRSPESETLEVGSGDRWFYSPPGDSNAGEYLRLLNETGVQTPEA